MRLACPSVCGRTRDSVCFISVDSPLTALDNVVLMPHVAWLTPETLDRSLEVAIENMRRLRDGGDLLFRVV